MILYHVSRPERRAQIEATGLRADPRERFPSHRQRGGLPGIYLWPNYEDAVAFTTYSPFLDIWEVDCFPDTTFETGEFSLHPNEVWTPESIPPERIRLLP